MHHNNIKLKGPIGLKSQWMRYHHVKGNIAISESGSPTICVYMRACMYVQCTVYCICILCILYVFNFYIYITHVCLLGDDVFYNGVMAAVDITYVQDHTSRVGFILL